LDVEREWNNLKAALAELEARGSLVLDHLDTASPTELQYRLRRNEYHVFHFIGHGGFNEQAQDGILLFEDENQRGHPLSGQYLGTLLHDENTLRLAVLNACEGGRSGVSDPFAGVAQSLVQQGLPAVIAMQFEVTDEAAITFAREFYTAIADGYPVDAALSEARKAIFSLGNDIEWGTPVLYMRAPDGRIFDPLHDSPAEMAPAKATPEEVVKPQLNTEAVRQSATARPATIATIQPTPAKKKPSKRVLVGIAASLVVITALCLSGISLGKRFLGGLTASESTTPAVNTTVEGQPASVNSPTEANQPDIPRETPAAFAPATLTSTPTPPAAFNLTNNREGKYAEISLLFDEQDQLHLVYRSVLPRGGDYYHQQRTGGGDFTPAEVLTNGFEFLWSDLVQALHPQGYICVLWGGVSENEGEAYFRRCQNSPGGSFSAAEIWKPKSFDTRTSFFPLFLPDGNLQAVFARVGSLTFGDQVISTDKATNIANPHLVRDPAGNYHVVWFRPGDPYSLEYSHSQDAGTSWSPAVRLTTDATAPDARFDFEADQQGNLHLVWDGFHGGSYYLRWNPTQGWSEPVKISPHGCGVELALNSSGLARAAEGCWHGTYFLEQLPNGDWLPPYQVAGTGNVLELDIAVDGNDQAYIVWVAENDIFFTSVR
ncbi:MAG: CHAT domain-containing protein, partial [Anaerolineales bacterium]